MELLNQIKFKKADSCLYCGERDKLEHLLFACDKVQIFWKAMTAWFNQVAVDRQFAKEFMMGLPRGSFEGKLIDSILIMARFLQLHNSGN